MRKPLLLVLAGIAALTSLVTAPVAAAADDPLKGDLDKLQGKWKANVTTDRGSGVWTLEIKGNKSQISIAGEDGNPVFKAENEFKLEKHGRFKAYTYFNLKILSGNNEGEMRLTGGENKSSIYKLDGDSMITVGGLRDDDEDKPLLVKWARP